MPSPFLIIRFVVLALVLYLSLLNLIFSSWNVNEMTSIGLGVPGSSVLLILNSCLVFICVGLAMVPLAFPNWNTAQVIFECAWSAVLSLFQIGTAIATTVILATVSHQTDDSGVNASLILLIPTSWLSSLCMLGHFFLLFMSATTHMRVDAEIWSKSIYSVKWFGISNVKLSSSDVSVPRPKTGFEEDTWASHLADIESSAARKARHPLADDEKAPWAPNNVRRGKDTPFRAPVSNDGSEPSSSRQPSPTPRANDALPPLPLRVEVKGPPIGSRFIERFRESQRLSRAGSLHIFPHEVDDHDLPIPLPRLSKWIRADGVKSKNTRQTP